MTAGNLHRGHGAKSPEARAASLANLKRGNVTHGARGGARLQTLREQHDVDLAATYPTMDDRRRRLLADRLARAECVADWLSEHGLVRAPASKGEAYPIVAQYERWVSRAEDLLAAAELEQRRHAATAGTPTLEQIQAEYAARALPRGDQGGDHE
jgi:hypothetical protein